MYRGFEYGYMFLEIPFSYCGTCFTIRKKEKGGNLLIPTCVNFYLLLEINIVFILFVLLEHCNFRIE